MQQVTVFLKAGDCTITDWLITKTTTTEIHRKKKIHPFVLFFHFACGFSPPNSGKVIKKLFYNAHNVFLRNSAHCIILTVLWIGYCNVCDVAEHIMYSAKIWSPQSFDEDLACSCRSSTSTRVCSFPAPWWSPSWCPCRPGQTAPSMPWGEASVSWSCLPAAPRLRQLTGTEGDWPSS